MIGVEFLRTSRSNRTPYAQYTQAWVTEMRYGMQISCQGRGFERWHYLSWPNARSNLTANHPELFRNVSFAEVWRLTIISLDPCSSEHGQCNLWANLCNGCGTATRFAIQIRTLICIAEYLGFSCQEGTHKNEPLGPPLTSSETYSHSLQQLFFRLFWVKTVGDIWWARLHWKFEKSVHLYFVTVKDIIIL